MIGTKDMPSELAVPYIRVADARLAMHGHQQHCIDSHQMRCHDRCPTGTEWQDNNLDIFI